jgi:hypothetical protein
MRQAGAVVLQFGPSSARSNASLNASRIFASGGAAVGTARGVCGSAS